MNVGDTIPDIRLPDQDGTMVDLANHRGKHVVLYFYPADHTPGCTAQACSFRDTYQDFQDAGAEVIGVSINGASKHQSFIEKYDLPFTLLTDKRGKVAKQLGVPKMLGLLTSRVTFVIDPDGKVIHRFHDVANATDHVKQSLQILQASQA